MGIFDSLASLTTNVVKVAVAPLEVVVDLADVVVQPLVDAAEVVTDGVKSLKD